MKKFLTNIMLVGVLLFPSSIKDPVTLSTWLQKDFKYEYDITNHWKSPKETIKDKTGDCEDFALLSRYILRKKGYRVYLVGIYYKYQNMGHVITVIRHKDKTFSYMTNQYYISTKFKTIRQLFDYESKSYNSRYTMKWEIAWFMVSKYIRPRFWRNKK